MSNQILFVEDDTDLRGLISMALRSQSFAVEEAADATEAADKCRTKHFDAVVADMCLPGKSGIDLCSELSFSHPWLPVVVVTGHGCLDAAIAAMRAGAYDFILKPIMLDSLLMCLHRAIGDQQIKQEVTRLRGLYDHSQPVGSIIGESTALKRMFTLIDRVANTDASILITGESGTGKELVARAMHERSERKNGPFVAINCAAMPLPLLESELFGHVRGAFTDAKRSRAGLLVQAQGGTLLLDEIGEMPLEMQSKLLRVLQERRVRPVGGDDEVPFDVRIVSSTNRDLESEIAAHRFRSDLYYRINVVNIPVPPLRSRGNDILLLAQHCLSLHAQKSGKGVLGIAPDAAKRLLSYSWPGNVRELKNSIDRAVAMASYSDIVVDDLPEKIRQEQEPLPRTDTSQTEQMVSLEEMERRYVHRALAAVGGNKTMAARILGIDRRSLYRRLDRLDKKT